MKVLVMTILITTALCSTSHAVSFDGLLGASFADKFDTDNGGYNSEDALTLGVRLKNSFKDGFGFNVGFGLDSIRDLKNTNKEIGFFLLEANGTLDIEQIKALYIYAGLNIPMLYDHKNVSNVDPAFGIQFGSGFNLGSQAGVEIGFRTVNFEFGSTDTNLWGFAIRGFYTFAAF
jgi:hypothetical protein